MKALMFSSVGAPSEVLRLEEIEEAKPSRDKVLLQMLFSPVNPSDLHMVRGSYGYQPGLPASPGAEGVGIVLEVGAGVTAVHVGDRVLCIGTWNLWRERAICKARMLSRCQTPSQTRLLPRLTKTRSPHGLSHNPSSSSGKENGSCKQLRRPAWADWFCSFLKFTDFAPSM